VFYLLYLVSSESDYNKMTTDNLAIVFQPTLSMQRKVILIMINHPDIFC